MRSAVIGLVLSAASSVVAGCGSRPAAAGGDVRPAPPVVRPAGVTHSPARPEVRYRISEEEVRRGAGREGAAFCVGTVYCGRIDGYATTSPPGGCGHHHCGTVVWSDGSEEPYHCTVYGRCEDGEFTARGFTW